MNNIDRILPEDLKSFPSYENYISELEKLRNYNFNDLSKREIYDIFYDYARILPTNTSSFSSDKFNYHKFYRVRLNINREKEDISLVQTYSYPPTEYCSENGRANLKGRSVFYCSNEPRTAVIECKPKIGDEGYLSVWNGVADRKIKTGVLLPFDLPNENIWNMMAKDSFENLRKTLPPKAKDKFKHFVALYSFIEKMFMTEKKPYHLTSMISEVLLYDQLWRDFIIYPSVMLDYKSCNMAFHPNSVNQNLQFEKVIEFKVVNIENDKLEYKLGKKVGVLKNTQIVWRNRTKQETEILK